MIESTSYMTTAYVIATAIYVVYSISLWSRERKLRRQLDNSRDQ
ncbi:MAG TPA: hypothetical protein VGM82_12450 [Gemmatimonadaceae bacterium]